MSEFGSTGDGDRRRRALILLVVVLGALVAVTALLWWDLSGTRLGVSLDEELADFPAPPELTAVSDMRTGTGAPFLGDRPGRRRVYASAASPAETCGLMDAALSEWQVDARPVGGEEERDASRPCALAGPRQARRLGVVIHVRVVVHTPEGYAELMAPGSREWPSIDPLPAAVVVLQLTRVASSGGDED